MKTIYTAIICLHFFLSDVSLADDSIFHRIVIDSKNPYKIGIAHSASEGTVNFSTLASNPSYRPSDLLENIPGLVATQHSGEGKANQFYLRGFNLDHGTDLKTTLDDMPINQRSHSHGQGWTDLNFLIPELVTRIHYTKGPYTAKNGDFSSAGSASITYANRLPQNTSSLSIGQHSYQRGLVLGSTQLNDTEQHLTYALESIRNDGPFIRPDHYKKLNGIIRYSQGYANNGLSLSAMRYQATWYASDQIPKRALSPDYHESNHESNQLRSVLDTVDKTDGGKSHRSSLSFIWRKTKEDEATKISAYLIQNQLDLFSNFTYFLDDPIQGDQFAQPDQRLTSGINAEHIWHTHWGHRNIDLQLGYQFQNDDINNALLKTQSRHIVGTYRKDRIQESSHSLYADTHIQWHPQWRTQTGLRYDYFQFDVKSNLHPNSGYTHQALFSPNFNLAYTPRKPKALKNGENPTEPASAFDNLELFFNWGKGFHSNDARSTTTYLNPKTLEENQPSQGLARSHAMELGFRKEWQSWQTSFSLYRLDFESELLFVGDAGNTEAGRPSRRIGWEFSNQIQLNQHVQFALDMSAARARYQDFSADGNLITGSVNQVRQLSLKLDRYGAWSGALRWRYFGPRALKENGSVMSRSTSTLNTQLQYQIHDKAQLEFEIFNLTNRNDPAIEYYYESRLKNEKTSTEDIHFHPTEPRNFRITFSMHF